MQVPMKNALFIISGEEKESIAHELKRRGNAVVTHQENDFQCADLEEKLVKQVLIERAYSDDDVPTFLTYSSYDVFMETLKSTGNQRYLQFEMGQKLQGHMNDIGGYRGIFTSDREEQISRSGISDIIITIPTHLSVIERVNIIEQMIAKILSPVYSRGFFTR